MKKKIFLGLTLLLAGSVTLFQVSCKKKPFDDLLIGVNTDVLSAPTLIVFENAKSGATNQPENFSLTITGKDKDKVLSCIASTTFKVQNGFISLNLAKGVVPTHANPITFTINGTAAGFEPLKQDIIITSNEEQRFNVKMIEVGNLPDGIVEVKQALALTSGAFTAPTTIETAPGNSTDKSVKMTFDAGTTMTDENGTKLVGTEVQTKIRYYDPQTEAVNVFPGGLNPQNVVDEKGNTIENGVQFYSAGLITVNMTVGSKVVKNFSKPVATEIKINNNQTNFTTGKQTVAGDKIPLWSCNEQTGQWKKEGEATVYDVNGELVAKFEVQHLSYWNLDHYRSGLSASQLDVVFDADWNAPSGNYYVSLHSSTGDYIGASYIGSIVNGTINTMTQTPNLDGAYLEVHNWVNDKSVKSDPFNPSTKGKIHVNVSSLNEDDLVNISLKYTVKCTKNKIKPNAGTWIVVTDVESNLKQVFRTPKITSQNTDGLMTFKLRKGRKYRVQTTGLDGNIISYESVLDVNNLKYTNPKGFTVNKFIYNSTTQTIEADVVYVTTKC